MSLIEINKPLLRLTREGGGSGPCRDTTIRFFGEPPSATYTYPAGTFITVDLLDESGNYLQIVSYTQVGSNIDIVVDSDTPIAVNGTPQGDITNWTPIGVNLEDSVGNPIAPVSTALVGNILTIEIDNDTPIEVNNVAQGDITNGTTIEVNLEDSVGNPVAPVSTALVGNILTIEVSTGVTPSGVYLQFPKGENWTSWRTGDPGWRAQNGWYDITQPANPAKFAKLDYGTANFWYRLRNPLIVNGVSSTTRFVDVDGGQTFSAVGNKDDVVIDKLTGLMFLRSTVLAANWNAAVDDALAYSITVGANTYNDWYLISVEENVALTGFNFVLGSSGTFDWIDALTGVRIASFNGNMVTGTSYNATNAMRYRVNPYYYDTVAKTTASPYAWFIRDARNLIS